MRNKRAIKSVQRVIDKYSEEFEVIAINRILNKKTGRFEDSRTKNVLFFAMFQKKYKKVFSSGGEYIDADMKIYSNVVLVESEVIISGNKKYKITFVEKRIECEPTVYICFGVLIDD